MKLRVVVAPTAFKGTASPVAVAKAIRAGWRRARPGDRIVLVPMADGGDGTAEVLKARLGGRTVRRTVRGPLGERVKAGAVLLPESQAVVEMASASGLALVPGGKLDPLRADTRGTGELVRACLDAGATTVYLGLGGSATTDGGAGCAHALGMRFVDADGLDLDPFPEALVHVEAVERSGMHPMASWVEGLVDVTNPLLGPRGAAAVYGPQKGADEQQVQLLELALSRLARAAHHQDIAPSPGAGAAGGLGFGVLALLGGRLVNGAQRIAHLVGLDGEIARADLVITGEGKLDRQTMAGKAPGLVGRHAKAAGVGCMAIVGHSDLSARDRRSLGIELVVPLGERSIEDAAADLASSL
jgi:glycerate kinase